MNHKELLIPNIVVCIVTYIAACTILVLSILVSPVWPKVTVTLQIL